VAPQHDRGSIAPTLYKLASVQVYFSLLLSALLLALRTCFAAPASDGAFGPSTMRDMARWR
jgi:hypothetical protein